jgi:hypothetical protein
MDRQRTPQHQEHVEPIACTYGGSAQVAVTNTYENGTNRLATLQAQRSTSSNYWIANRVYT